MHLGEPDCRHADALRRPFLPRQFGHLARVRVVAVEAVLERGQAGAAVAHAGARCDEKGPVRANEHSAYRLDDPAIFLDVCDEAGEVVVEGGVDHGVGLGGARRDTCAPASDRVRPST
ncbi:hypothetical protein G6F53_013986 [Rhizopus delemar]|nr:hypothetical protein G6F53_013986 [Rhizopus delemar]